jgi:hypothetical protein
MTHHKFKYQENAGIRLTQVDVRRSSKQQFTSKVIPFYPIFLAGVAQ